ncbi:MAG: signal peptidase I [Alphaproteobacteria bacterium]|nr:signal peptidase I [Alphaproteobacteria bacterium]
MSALVNSPVGRSLMRRSFVRLSLVRFQKSYWIISLFFLCCWLVVSQTRLRECLSDSLDGINYVLFLKSSSIQRGDIVSIQGHREDHVGTLPKWPYAKRVLGIPGDRIIHNNSGITVIPKESDGLSLLTKTSKGKLLTPIVPFIGVPLNGLSKTIPEGCLFVAGDNPKSFDSRYDEFGLVPMEKVWGKGILQW